MPKGRKNGCRLVTDKLLLIAILFAMTACVCAAEPGPSKPSNKLIDPELVLEPFEKGLEKTRVIVNLSKPSQIPIGKQWDSPGHLKRLHDEVMAIQAGVLAGFKQDELKLRRRFENQAAFSAQFTRQALDKLLNNPDVVSVEPVRILKAHLAQGIGLMNGMTYRPTFNGQGVSVAICDTGIDYTHPQLGGGSFPNAKVIGGYDFGDSDSNPIPNTQPHGTSCAGIAAGDANTVGDYIGGVAYNAKLYALKISYGTTGSAYLDDIAAAWDWCVTHKNDDPENPILVISTSFGGGRYTSVCDGISTAMASAADNAVAAGITVVSSAGNEGYCDAMGTPACINNVISVGAVYDADFGQNPPPGWVGCIGNESCVGFTDGCPCDEKCFIDESTAPDQVTTYSNSVDFLDLFAPADNAYTTDIAGSGGYTSGDFTTDFGGTSAACPYVAGSIACLQSAAKAATGDYLTPDDIRNTLILTGENVTDPKASITKPRVNLGWAIATVAGDPVPPTAYDQALGVGPGQQMSITLDAHDDGKPNPPGKLEYIIDSLPEYGSLSDPCASDIQQSNIPYTLSNFGSEVVYHARNCYIGPESFTFRAFDGATDANGGYSNTATVTVNINVDQAQVYNTGFDSGLPAGWSIIDNLSDGYTWNSTNPCGRSSSYMTGTFMIVDAKCPRRIDRDEQLISKSFNCSNLTNVTLSFNHFFTTRNAIADVDISIDSGPWQNLLQYSNDTEGPVETDISAIADGHSDVRIRWRLYNAYSDGIWGIDDVSLTASQAYNSLVGDLKVDCFVDLADFAMLATAWLSDPNDAAWNDSFDISEPRDNIIDAADMLVLSQHWLEEGQ